MAMTLTDSNPLPGCFGHLVRSLVEVLNCLDTLGKLPWPRSALEEVWLAVQGKVPSLQKRWARHERRKLIKKELHVETY